MLSVKNPPATSTPPSIAMDSPQQQPQVEKIADTKLFKMPRVTGGVLTSLVSGAIAGGTAKSTIAPLDRTKIYFQTHPDKGYKLKGAVKFLRLTYETYGFRSLWRGNSATMVRIIPYSGIQFFSHEQYKIYLGLDRKDVKPPDLMHFVAGSLAGVTAQMMTYPLDRARAVMAVTVMGEYKHLGEVFRKIIREEGVCSLYRGFAPTMLGVAPYAGISFFTYETLIKLLQDHKDRRDESEKISVLERYICGATAGLLGQVTTYPLDIVRRRMQTAKQMGIAGNKYASILGTLVYVYRKEGIRKGWFKGVTMNFIKGPISTGISFTVYDFSKTSIQKMTNNNK